MTWQKFANCKRKDNDAFSLLNISSAWTGHYIGDIIAFMTVKLNYCNWISDQNGEQKMESIDS